MTTITIRLPKEEKDKLFEIAKQKDLTASQLIRKAIRLLLEEE